MIRRLVLTLAAAAAGLYLSTRLLRQPGNEGGDPFGTRPADRRRGVVDRVSGAAAGAASTAARIARRIATRQS
jgi:hypothetical protein